MQDLKVRYQNHAISGAHVNEIKSWSPDWDFEQTKVQMQEDLIKFHDPATSTYYIKKAVADYSDGVLDKFVSYAKGYHYWVAECLHRTKGFRLPYPLSKNWSGIWNVEFVWHRSPRWARFGKGLEPAHRVCQTWWSWKYTWEHYLRIGRDCSLQLFETQVVAI